MIVSPNLGLKIWNLSTDPYNSSQLAENLQKIDDHDHANGRGKQVPTGGIADGAITSAKLDPGLTLIPSDDSVSTIKIQNSSVTSAKILDGTIATGDIAPLAIDNTLLAANSVTASKLAADAKIVTGSADQTGVSPQVVTVGSWTDITGVTASFTPSVPSVLICIATASLGLPANSTCDIRLNLDGAQTGVAASTYPSASAANYPAVTAFAVTSVTAAAHTIKLQAYSLTSSVNIYKSVTASPTTGLRYFLLPA